MLAVADAALLIGEPALLARLRTPLGLQKIDLGAAWKAMTGLPFVYAFWAGAPGVLTPADVRRAAAGARRRAAAIPTTSRRSTSPDEPETQALGAAYLREYIRYDIGERERAALERFFALAAEIGAAPPARPLRFYAEPAERWRAVSHAEPGGTRAVE